VQIATNANFTTILQQSTVLLPTFNTNLLNSNTTYFWRVRPKNICATGSYSSPFSFTTVCLEPTNLMQTGASTTSASLIWMENSGANTWEIKIVPQGTVPIGNGIQITTNPYVATGLSSNTCYDIYIRSNCGAGTSNWSNKLSVCTQANYCGGDHFYDSGGLSGSYQNSENYTKVIYPENSGDRVRAVFNNFQTESGYDYLKIYNGPNVNSPLLINVAGSAAIGTIVSTHPSGALTFSFSSDSSVVSTGWDASIFCEPLPACPIEPSSFYKYLLIQQVRQ
jgi:CUB domain